MPVYNEAGTVRAILDKVLESPLVKEVIVVDDGSTDGTRAILQALHHPQVRVELHDRNRGKGAALRTAIPLATADLVVVQDADLEYDPVDYAALARPLLEGKADVVYGSRFLGEHRVFLFWHYLGNRFLTLVTNLLYNTMLTDMETCYKMFRREAIQGVSLASNRFDIEPEITAKVFKRGWRVIEVPIRYHGRDYQEGKKITWRDGLVALATLLKYRFRD